MTLARMRNPTLAGCLAVWGMVLGASPGRALAMPSESVTSFLAASDRAVQIEKIMQVLSRPEAQVPLRTYGVTPQQLREKLAQLDDSQLSGVAQKAESVRSAGILGLIITLLVIAILVVILIYLLRPKEVRIVEEKT